MKSFLRILVLLFLSFVLAACFDRGNGEPNVNPSCELGGVSINEPTYKDTYTASSISLRLGGNAPLASDYVTWSSDPGVTVTWDNKATGNSGTAISLASCSTSFLGTFCNHEWSAGIGLSSVGGDNYIEVSAHENGVFVGGDCITVTYVPYEPAILPLWIDSFGTSENDTGRGIAVDTNGNSYITGFTQEQGYSPNIHEFIAKYDTSGNQLWIKNDLPVGYAGFGIDVDANGNSYISGYSITKYDTSGNQLWTKNDFPVGYVGYGIDVDENGTIYIVGSTGGDPEGSNFPWGTDAFVAKYDTFGNQLWLKQFGTSSIDVGHGIAVDANGNSYVTGKTVGDLAGTENAGSYDAFIAKYDTSGNQLWIKQYGTSSYDETIGSSYLNDDAGRGIAVDTNGNSYITGYTEKDIVYSTARQYDVFITKYDTSGNQLWVKELFTSGDYDEKGYGIAVDEHGNSYITGSTEGNLAGTGNAGGEGEDVFIAKVDTDGNQVWIRQYGTSNADKGYGIAVDANGNSYITGYWDGYTTNTGDVVYYDLFIMALSP